MSRVYLDACAIIYLHEASSDFHASMRDRLQPYRGDPSTVLVTSRLSRLECRVKPLREQNEELLEIYEDFFNAEQVEVKDLSAAVIERATDHRVRYGLKTPDAIHTASAVEARADVLITGDKQLARVDELTVDVIEEAE